MAAALSTIAIGLVLASIICITLWCIVRKREKLEDNHNQVTEPEQKVEQATEEAVMRTKATGNLQMSGRIARSNPDCPN